MGDDERLNRFSQLGNVLNLSRDGPLLTALSQIDSVHLQNALYKPEFKGHLLGLVGNRQIIEQESVTLNIGDELKFKTGAKIRFVGFYRSPVHNQFAYLSFQSCESPDEYIAMSTILYTNLEREEVLISDDDEFIES